MCVCSASQVQFGAPLRATLRGVAEDHPLLLAQASLLLLAWVMVSLPRLFCLLQGDLDLATRICVRSAHGLHRGVCALSQAVAPERAKAQRPLFLAIARVGEQARGALRYANCIPLHC